MYAFEWNRQLETACFQTNETHHCGLFASRHDADAAASGAAAAAAAENLLNIYIYIYIYIYILKIYWNIYNIRNVEMWKLWKYENMSWKKYGTGNEHILKI